MRYETPEMGIIKLEVTDIIVTSDGLNDSGDNDQETGGGLDLFGKTGRF